MIVYAKSRSNRIHFKCSPKSNQNRRYKASPVDYFIIWFLIFQIVDLLEYLEMFLDCVCPQISSLKKTYLVLYSNEDHCKAAASGSGLHVWLVIWRSWVRAPSKAHVVSLSKKRYHYCLVLDGSRNGFERDFTIELKSIEGLMKDWLKCQISPLVQYRQNQTVKL